MPNPRDYYGESLGVYGDAGLIRITNHILDDIQAEKGVVISQEWRDAFYDTVIDAYVQSDILWAGEPVARFIFGLLNEPYDELREYTGQPIYIPIPSIEEEGTKINIDIRRQPTETPPISVPPVSGTRIPPVTPPGTPPKSGTDTVPPVSLPERKTPVEIPGIPKPETLPRTLPPVAAPEPSGLSPEDKKKIDDTLKELEETKKELNDKLDKIAEEQKKAIEAGKGSQPLDLAALRDILIDLIDRWWRLSQVYPLHVRIKTEPEDEPTGEEIQNAIISSVEQAVKAVSTYRPVPDGKKAGIDPPFSIPQVS